jgi:hypothetical protein
MVIAMPARSGSSGDRDEVTPAVVHDVNRVLDRPLLGALAELIPDPVVGIGEKGRIEVANHLAPELSGYMAWT